MSTATPGTTGLQNTERQSIGGYVSHYFRRIRQGDLGSLPIILGLIAIAVIFQTQNENYLTARNFVNLVVQMAGITTIAIGVVFVLLLGEIDLSIGYTSAVAAVSAALLMSPGYGWPWFLAVPLALLVAAGIGLVQGMIITRYQARLWLVLVVTFVVALLVDIFPAFNSEAGVAGALPRALLQAVIVTAIVGALYWFVIRGTEVPSFIVTLAGLLAWNGVVLLMVGRAGTVSISNTVVIGITNTYLPELVGWSIASVIVLGYAAIQIWQWNTRRSQQLTTRPIVFIALEVLVLAALVGAAVYVANLDRGVPVIALILLVLLVGFSYLATRTPFGRYVYAVGGNREAARRAGIPVERIRLAVFVLSSTMAGLGGIVLASRLRSVATDTGGGNLLLNSIAAAVIGGTSLFGGSGRVVSALLGALVIASVDSGMGLLGYSAGQRFIITGVVLLIAVLIDSLSRRGRTAGN